MTYQVLARKWRPKTFSELVGQQHVVRALTNGLDTGRVHHAFLFTGTRGVGKTTIARIFSKALNCLEGVSAEPCGKCAICEEVDQGRFVDLIEIDAASRTGVDDMRELLDNVPYAPSRGRFKVYLIDEVHMLSKSSFNALLKTLEEPPEHVKFLLATTDPEKLPVTVLSRCLQFNLKRLTQEEIGGQIERIVNEEGVESDPEAIREIAFAADGSLRDGLSLLDQAIAFGGGRLDPQEVRAMLGTVERRHLDDMLRALANRDAEALWQSLEQVGEFAPDYDALLRELAASFHEIQLAQLLPGRAESSRALIAELAASLQAEDVQLYYQMAVQGRQEIEHAPDMRSGFESAVLRMLVFHPAAMEPSAGQPSTPAASSAAAPAKPDARAKASEAGAAPPPATAPAAPARQPAPQATHAAAAAPGDGDDEWNQLINRLGLEGPARMLASHAALESRGKGVYRLVVEPSYAHLRTGTAEDRIREAFARVLGPEARVEFSEGAAPAETPASAEARRAEHRQQSAEQAIAADPLVQNLQDKFGAMVLPGSVKATGES